MGKVAEQAITPAAQLTPLPTRIQALMTDVSVYAQPHLTDRKSRREAIRAEARAIAQESWAQSTEVQRLVVVAARRGDPRIGRRGTKVREAGTVGTLPRKQDDGWRG
jgi:hypothetical protein